MMFSYAKGFLLCQNSSSKNRWWESFSQYLCGQCRATATRNYRHWAQGTRRRSWWAKFDGFIQVNFAEIGQNWSYRVPISLGAPRVEKDNKGNECQVFDIVVNEQYLEKVTKENATYQIGFVVSVALQGLEQKYELDLDRNWIMLKNRKVFSVFSFCQNILGNGQTNSAANS